MNTHHIHGADFASARQAALIAAAEHARLVHEAGAGRRAVGDPTHVSLAARLLGALRRGPAPRPAPAVAV